MGDRNADGTSVKDKSSILGRFGNLPVTLETEFNKDPQDLAQDCTLNFLDVLASTPSMTDRHNSGAPRRSLRNIKTPVPLTYPAHEWAHTGRLSEQKKGAFNVISRQIMAFIKSPGCTGDCQALRIPFEIAMEKSNESAILLECLLRHIISFYPKLCNPQVEKGREALDRLVYITSYLTTEGFKKKNYHKVTVEQIDLVFSEYIELAYPYPISGKEPFQTTLRYQFVCLNYFALKLAEKGLMRNLLPAKKAFEVINMMLPGEKVQCENHESILIGSQWVKRYCEVKNLHSDEMMVDWIEAWHKITEYESEYEALPEEHKGLFKQHAIATSEARLAMEAEGSTWETWYLQWQSLHFRDNHKLILSKAEDLLSCPLFDEIRQLNEVHCEDPFSRSVLLVELDKNMRGAYGLLRNRNTAQEARGLAENMETLQAQPRWAELGICR